MEILKKYWVAGVAVLIIIIGGYSLMHKTPQVSSSGITTGSSTPPTASSTAAAGNPGASATTPFPINKADTIASWNFSGSYVGNITLETEANANIQKLTNDLKTGKTSAYQVYNGIGNDYMFLGNGKSAYEYYNKAIATDPNKAVAYMNLAHLMDQLGAKHTAIDAYKKSVAAEPTVSAYWLAYVNFLVSYEPKASLTQTTFTAALKATNNAPDVLIVKANWEEGIGQISAAIATWKQVRPSVSPSQQQAIDNKIAKLQSELK